MIEHRRRKRRSRTPAPPVVTREQFIERFAQWFNEQGWDYREGMAERLGAQIYDTIFGLLDGAVMPPTSVWMRDIVQKLEAYDRPRR